MEQIVIYQNFLIVLTPIFLVVKGTLQLLYVDQNSKKIILFKFKINIAAI